MEIEKFDHFHISLSLLYVKYKYTYVYIRVEQKNICIKFTEFDS